MHFSPSFDCNWGKQNDTTAFWHQLPVIQLNQLPDRSLNRLPDQLPWWLIPKSVTKSITTSITRSVTKSVTRSVTRLIPKSVTRSIIKSVTRSVTRSVTKSVTRLVTTVTRSVPDQSLNRLPDLFVFIIIQYTLLLSQWFLVFHTLHNKKKIFFSKQKYFKKYILLYFKILFSKNFKKKNV